VGWSRTSSEPTFQDTVTTERVAFDVGEIRPPCSAGSYVLCVCLLENHKPEDIDRKIHFQHEICAPS
jgi:hypothetical protein